MENKTQDSENIQGERSWYQKKRYVVPATLLTVFLVAGYKAPEDITSQSVRSASPSPSLPKQEIRLVQPTKQEVLKPKPTVAESCNPNYSGCLKPYASDYDCAGGSGNGPYYTGTVRVLGYDEYELDRDGNGWGCER